MTRNRVPPSRARPTSIRPSCASTILRTIASPSPDPCGLVVKNGLKIRSITSGGMPGPLSRLPPAPSAPAASLPAGPLFRQRGRGDPDRALAVHRLEGVHQQVREHLPQLVRVALNRRQVVGHARPHVDVAARHVALRQRNRVADRRRRARCARPAAGSAGRTRAPRARWRWPSWLP